MLTATPASVALGNWTPLYQGIEYAVGVATSPFDTTTPAVRIQKATAMRIDLQAPGIEFVTTPKGGSFQTIGQTVTGFLAANPSVQVAINANFSWVEGGVFQVGAPYSLLGLAMTGGKIVCDPTKPAPRPAPLTNQPDVPDLGYAGAVALMITRDNRASFGVVTAANPAVVSNLFDVWTAVAGSPPPSKGAFPPVTCDPPPWLVQGAVNQIGLDCDANKPVAARTAVGLSQDSRYLFLMVIEGCEHTQPKYGASLHDVAAWLLLAGASDGINLDGGGSSVMAMKGQNGAPVLFNLPYADEKTPGLQRPVGNFLGVIACPLSAGASGP